jgi:hypothetical protein
LRPDLILWLDLHSPLLPPFSGLHCGSGVTLSCHPEMTTCFRQSAAGSIAAGRPGRTARQTSAVFPPVSDGLHCGANASIISGAALWVFPPVEGGLHCGLASRTENVSPASNDRDRAGQTGKFPMFGAGAYCRSAGISCTLTSPLSRPSAVRSLTARSRDDLSAQARRPGFPGPCCRRLPAGSIAVPGSRRRC